MDEIWDLTESVSEGCLTYSYMYLQKQQVPLPVHLNKIIHPPLRRNEQIRLDVLWSVTAEKSRCSFCHAMDDGLTEQLTLTLQWKGGGNTLNIPVLICSVSTSCRYGINLLFYRVSQQKRGPFLNIGQFLYLSRNLSKILYDCNKMIRLCSGEDSMYSNTSTASDVRMTSNCTYVIIVFLSALFKT